MEFLSTVDGNLCGHFGRLLGLLLQGGGMPEQEYMYIYIYIYIYIMLVSRRFTAPFLDLQNERDLP